MFGVPYVHFRLAEGDDLYVTEHGTPFVRHLLPRSFLLDREWFHAHSQKLFGHNIPSGGSGTLYRVKTKPVDGHSLDIVLKWNRMAQDVPGHRDSEELQSAEFNSPFEEFALVMEMRRTGREAGRKRILTHKPLAIYVPADAVDPERLGRREYKMRQKVRSHSEVDLDLHRRYAVIYEWVKGIDLAEAFSRQIVTEAQMAGLTAAVDTELRALGYWVHDRKPQHIIVRPTRRSFQPQRGREVPPYALVDFELLERTPEREDEIRTRRRREYLARQAHRFERRGAAELPEPLRLVTILGVDYVMGPAESTGGVLWVVGRDPALFDYFLPERWHTTPRTRLSAVDEVYETVSKDDIHIVWKASRVGRIPDLDPFRPQEKRIIEHGYNSPFEEVALALELSQRGVPSTFPRAIYMTHHTTEMAEHLRDNSRYTSPEYPRLEDGQPSLRPDREYVSIWGYWNKTDDQLAAEDGDYYQSIDALRALREGLIDEQTYFAVLARTREKLVAIGVEDLDFGGRHKLLSLDPSGRLILDADRLPSVRICGFELMRHVPKQEGEAP